MHSDSKASWWVNCANAQWDPLRLGLGVNSGWDTLLKCESPKNSSEPALLANYRNWTPVSLLSMYY